MSKDIKRIKLKLKSEDSTTLSGWQLQEFIKNVNKGYCKLDIINEISRLINQGEKPENIIIINIFNFIMIFLVKININSKYV